MLPYPLLLLLAYLIGAIPCGVVLTRLCGKEDVRNSGSGNIGATNVYRVAGRKLGIATLIGDAFKGVIPVLLAQVLLQLPPEQVAGIAGATFLGHLYPIYLRFKGGKGVATAMGIFLVLSPLSILGALLCFALVLWKWRYVSLASICGATIIPFLVRLQTPSLPLVSVTTFIALMVVIRHRENIVRLRKGTENRFKA